MLVHCQLSFWEAFRIPKHWQMASGLHHHRLPQHYRRCALLTLFLVISLQESLLAQLSSFTEWFLGGWMSLSQLLWPYWFTGYSKVLWWAKGTWWIIYNMSDFLGYSQMYATHSITSILCGNLGTLTGLAQLPMCPQPSPLGGLMVTLSPTEDSFCTWGSHTNMGEEGKM